VHFSAQLNPSHNLKTHRNFILFSLAILHFCSIWKNHQRPQGTFASFTPWTILWGFLNHQNPAGSAISRLCSSRCHSWQLKIRAKPSYLEPSNFIHTAFKVFVFTCIKDLQAENIKIFHCSSLWYFFEFFILQSHAMFNEDLWMLILLSYALLKMIKRGVRNLKLHFHVQTCFLRFLLCKFVLMFLNAGYVMLIVARCYCHARFYFLEVLFMMDCWWWYPVHNCKPAQNLLDCLFVLLLLGCCMNIFVLATMLCE
jgi:hypothetical protein